MPRRLTRRGFLTAAATTAAGLAVPGALVNSVRAAQQPPSPLTYGLSESELEFVKPRPAKLDLWGRITWAGYPLRAEPGLNKPVVEFIPVDTVLPLLEIIHAEGGNPNNTLWYRVENGYLYTSGVQPIKPYRMPEIVTEIDTVIDGEPGFWGQVIVPYTIPRNEPNGLQVYDEYFGRRIPVMHYYGSVHRVVEVVLDRENNAWYKCLDDKPGRPPVYVLGRHMRKLTEKDFEPINPGANKEMVVTLSTQTIECFEDGKLVFKTLTSSGAGGFPTPTGEHAVVYKQPSRHMYTDPNDPVMGGDAVGDEDFFDLPGVPFSVFFTTMGHASHGTWWHGDYGRPRSHGCLNVTPEDAQWLYRWVEPVASYSESAAGSSSNPGTPIIVVD